MFTIILTIYMAFWNKVNENKHSKDRMGRRRDPQASVRRSKPDGGSGKRLWKKAQDDLESQRIHFVDTHNQGSKIAHVVDNWARFVGFPMQYLLLVSTQAIYLIHKKQN